MLPILFNLGNVGRLFKCRHVFPFLSSIYNSSVAPIRRKTRGETATIELETKRNHHNHYTTCENLSRVTWARGPEQKQSDLRHVVEDTVFSSSKSAAPTILGSEGNRLDLAGPFDFFQMKSVLDK